MSGRKRIRRSDILLKEKIKQQIVNLIERERVDTFFVEELGGFENDAYDAVLELRSDFPQIKVVLVISKISELNRIETDESEYVSHLRYFDDFIYPDACAVGFKRWSIVYRNNYIVDNADFIIAYNRYKGRAYNFCKKAKNKNVVVIELYDEKNNLNKN